MAIDFSTVTGLTTQIKALQDQAAVTSDPTVKAILNSQGAVAAAQLTAELTHMQAQSDASSNLLSTMGLFATLTSVVGGAAPSIIALLKP